MRCLGSVDLPRCLEAKSRCEQIKFSKQKACKEPSDEISRLRWAAGPLALGAGETERPHLHRLALNVAGTR